MSDANQREWRFCLDDMIDLTGKVLAYTDGLDQAGFMASGLTYDATRNRHIHGYFGIDNNTLWSIIQNDIPELLPLFKALKNESQS